MARLGRAAGSALRVYDLLRQRIVVSIPRAAAELDLTWPTVKSAIERLDRLGIAHEMTGRSRDRLYAYKGQLDILNAGTEPLLR